MLVRNKVAPHAYVMRWNLDHRHVEVLAGQQHRDGSTVGVSLPMQSLRAMPAPSISRCSCTLWSHLTVYPRGHLLA